MGTLLFRMEVDDKGERGTSEYISYVYLLGFSGGKKGACLKTFTGEETFILGEYDGTIGKISYYLGGVSMGSAKSLKTQVDSC